jgi:DNA-binding response OmpR family regulator
VTRVLIVEDDANIASLLTQFLRDEGFDVSAEQDGLRALDAAERDAPDVVLLDLFLPNMDGETFYREFRRRGYQSHVVVMSASRYGSRAARELGVASFLPKPFDLDAVSDVIRAELAS